MHVIGSWRVIYHGIYAVQTLRNQNRAISYGRVAPIDGNCTVNNTVQAPPLFGCPYMCKHLVDKVHCTTWKLLGILENCYKMTKFTRLDIYVTLYVG